jgi:serine/threonine-protein kinase RsbW
VSLNLPFAPQSAGAVRRALTQWLRHQGVDAEVVHDAGLVATELVSNAVRHASPLRNGTMLVRWRQEAGGLVLSVHDGGGAGRPTLTVVDPDAERGRGMAIIDSLSLRWWTERNHQVTTVSVYLPLG